MLNVTLWRLQKKETPSPACNILTKVPIQAHQINLDYPLPLPPIKKDRLKPVFNFAAARVTVSSVLPGQEG